MQILQIGALLVRPRRMESSRGDKLSLSTTPDKFSDTIMQTDWPEAMNQVATKLDRPRDGYFQFS